MARATTKEAAVNAVSTQPYAVLAWDAVFGPFKDANDAARWAFDHFKLGTPWHVKPLLPRTTQFRKRS